VEERGRAVPLGRFCENCWNEYRNLAARADGITNPQLPESDPDELSWYEPPNCPACGVPLHLYRTNYDHWVAVELEPLPAKQVPSLFRWRLKALRARNSPTTIDVIAVRITGIEPTPGEPVLPAHRFHCPAAQDEVLAQRIHDHRQRQHPPAAPRSASGR
jgi:hypothetical protein